MTSGTWRRGWQPLPPIESRMNESYVCGHSRAGSERDGYDVVVPRPMLKVRKAAMAGALVLIVALAVPGWLRIDRWWNGVPVRWMTAQGEFRTLHLADGTQVSLDADSELVVKLGAHVRRVSLVRGEALFAVTHDASRPFEVEMGPGRLVDLGTRFDVEKLPDAVRVAVFEGRVGVETHHGEVVLGAGRRGGYDDLGNLLTTDQADTATVARADGLRHFDSEPLAVVLARMSRYHPVTFVFSQPQLEQLRVSGTFRLTDLSLFLRTLLGGLAGGGALERTAEGGNPPARCRRGFRQLTPRLLLLGFLQGIVLAVAGMPTACGGEAAADTVLYSFDIPPGSLKEAIDRLAASTRLQVLYDPSVVNGRLTRGVKGSMTLAQALEQLLAQTDIAYRLMAADTVALYQDPGGGEHQPDPPQLQRSPLPQPLPVVQVSAQRSQALYSVTDSGSDGHESGRAPVLATPVTFATVTHDSLEDQQAGRVEDILEGVSGIEVAPDGQDTVGFIIREVFLVYRVLRRWGAHLTRPAPRRLPRSG